MDNKLQEIFDNVVKNYKEVLTNKNGKSHVYFFRYEDKVEQGRFSTKGFYAIDEYGVKWLSVDAMSSIFLEQYYEKLRSKYFDINNEDQKLFYSLEIADLMNTNSEYEQLINIIKSNVRQGSPRKFITLNTGEKVNIELSIETVSKYEF